MQATLLWSLWQAILLPIAVGFTRRGQQSALRKQLARPYAPLAYGLADYRGCLSCAGGGESTACLLSTFPKIWVAGLFSIKYR